MRNWYTYLVLAVVLLCGTPGTAQQVQVSASTDTTSMRIGEQIRLTLRVDYRIDKGEVNVGFPVLTDSVATGIEIVRKDSLVKSLPNKSDQFLFRQQQQFVLTIFEEGSYTIPAFAFLVNDELYETTPIAIEVATVAVDTTQPIKPIKEIYEIVGENLSEEEEEANSGFMAWLKNNWIWLLIILAILIAAFIVIRHYMKKPPQQEEVVVPPTVAPDILALQQLRELKEKSLWQTGRIKEYHVELTDILRTYLESRFQIPAHEQTTEEIMSMLRFAPVDEQSKMVLNQVLRLSDMVKFAREKPVGMENEQSYNSAQAFIEATREVYNQQQRTA